MINTECLTRKRIWDVDCLSLDAALAASFEWRDLMNILQGHGEIIDFDKPEAALEMQAQCRTHEFCHSENKISLGIEKLLNDWHKNSLQTFSAWSPSKVAEYVLSASWNNMGSVSGIFWALGSDSREGFSCICRRFHQRFQIHSVRQVVIT